MSRNLKIFLGISYLIILFTFLYFIFTGIEVTKLNDFSYYKELQKNLSNYVSNNTLTNLIYFFIFAVIWVALLGFGSPLLIISGILFGQWIGTFVSAISISIGALILYTLGNFFFRDFVKQTLEQKFDKTLILLNDFTHFSFLTVVLKVTTIAQHITTLTFLINTLLIRRLTGRSIYFYRAH